MPIPLTCSCTARMNAPDSAAGKKVRCPKCGAALAVPGGAPAASPPPAPSKRPARAAPRPQPVFAPAPGLEERWAKSPLLSETTFLTRQKTRVRKYGPEYQISLPGAKDALGEANIRTSGLLVFLG